MEIPPMENSQLTINSSDVVAPHYDQHNLVPTLTDSSNGGGGGEPDHRLSAEEVKGTLEIVASTGKFWHDWDELKSMLSFQLKQVLSEYPEARNSSLKDSYPQLLKSLEEALFSFIEGPPFTLQRLCEILLNARIIYPNLSKLALALEKNLLVTSTLTKSTDPYPPLTVELADASPEQVVDAEPILQPQSQPQPPTHPSSLENGGQATTVGDRDEVMSEVGAEVEDGMTIDMETFEDIIGSSDTSPQSNDSVST